MLSFENAVADYVKNTNNHVLYRVTPVFTENNLLCNGLLMEGYSVEDLGAGICFCVFAYNNQPGILIDYTTGESRLDPDYAHETSEPEPAVITYVLNTKSMKFHDPDCESAKSISNKNRQDSSLARKEIIARGYDPCGFCNP